MKTAKKIAILAIVIYDILCVCGYFADLSNPENVPVPNCNTTAGQVANCGTTYIPHWTPLAAMLAWNVMIGIMYWLHRKGVQ